MLPVRGCEGENWQGGRFSFSLFTNIQYEHKDAGITSGNKAKFLTDGKISI